MGDKPAVTRDTFSKLPTGSKLDILFDYMMEMHDRIEELQSKKSRNKTLAAITGCAGGAIAFFSSKLFTIFQ